MDASIRKMPAQAAPRATDTDALAIFAKYPEPGRVKTRLGKTIGDAQAAAIYRAFLGDLAARFTAAASEDGYALVWACQPGMLPLTEIVGAAVECFGQRGETLDLRLWNACEELRVRGYRRAVIVGSDAPHLPAALVREALALLETQDVVLGPAEDGGYYLVGLRLEPEPPDLFRGIEMSTATVCAETLRRAQALGLRVALLPELFDVDEAANLARLGTLLADGTYVAPLTREAIQGLAIGR